MEHQHAPVPTEAPAHLAHDSADYEYAFTPVGAGYEHTDADTVRNASSTRGLGPKLFSFEPSSTSAPGARELRNAGRS